ncbi:MerR family DNA-binding transcriptional regulator [Streptomyces albipurpureus]|uniref:MerR family DNA-binding transcriptional regulator n=1 Tax=Streptomyces albipurpureus TaxID=2897419 RepID=A0ABT0UU86_9ACTN|nr:MerR family DNA-binding transcriptional regulator [Streptomyces sp. CWNU-1]MCM2392157.1 MerR family DNA-binding transcriptional regulator [Streptomyces sp. CWNU-1]
MSIRKLRPVDLAREHGLSTQAIRNYEEEGILPAAERTPHGYRLYTALHAQALRTFIALVPGHGHHCASQIMRTLNNGDLDAALTLVDESHGQLLQDRRTLAAVEKALHDLASTEPPAQSERAATFIGPLAQQLGIRPATLRKWERADLIRPRRDPATGYRVYTPTDVRDAHLAHQLRRGGYLLHQIAPLIAQVRDAGGLAPLGAALHDWRTRLTNRRLAMLAAAAELTTCVNGLGPLPRPHDPAP